MFVRMWRNGNPPELLVGKQIDAVTMENSMEFPQKIRNGTALCHKDSTSEDISKESQNTVLKEYMHLSVHCSVIDNGQDLEAAQVPISR